MLSVELGINYQSSVETAQVTSWFIINTVNKVLYVPMSE